MHQRKSKILCLSVFLALFAHILGIYLLKDMKTDTYTSKHSWMEHQGIPLTENEIKIKEMAKRDKQLATVFKELSKPSKETRSQYDFNPHKTDILSSNDIVRDLNFSEIASIEFSSTPDDALLAETKNIYPNRVESQRQLDVPCSSEIVQELAKATEKLKGNFPDVTPELFKSIHTIKVGSAEEASLDGNAFQSIPGLIDKGDLFAKSVSQVDDIKLDVLRQLNLADKPSSFFPTGSHEIGLARDSEANSAFISSECGTIASSNDFSIKVEYSPIKNASGYIFRLELMPKEKAAFKRIRQNLFFLIDRSHSIREKRYEASKDAVVQALNMLQPGDTFNILVFDKKIVKLARNNLPWSPQGIAKAAQFLKKQKYGGVFATTDLYSSMGNIVPEAVAEHEVNTAILLSDGDTYLNSDKQRETIAKWTKKNSGRISLYSLASGGGNNLPLLDVLSTFNKGTLRYSTSDDQLEQTLLTLMDSIKNPIGKDILVTAISPDGLCIKIFPMSSHLPNLYEHAPFVVYGSISEMKDFTIFFQGRYYDKWLDIKQTVSFKEAAIASEEQELERMWAVQLAYDDYALYLKDGNRNHLAHAKQILAPFHLPIAFE